MNIWHIFRVYKKFPIHVLVYFENSTYTRNAYPALRETMEIVPGIHQVDGVNGNCYLIVRHGITVIDTGLPGAGKTILSYIQGTLGRTPSDIRTIILTHYHIDHTGNVNMLRSASAGKVAIHGADAPFVSGQEKPPRPGGCRGTLFAILGTFMKTQPFTPDIILNDRDVINGMTCIHIPGHTPGSIGLLDPGTGIFFVGDTLRFDGQRIEGPPPQFTRDMALAHESMKKIAALDFDIMLSGHGVPLRPGASGKVREFVTSRG
jgi:glyoxylase-like metal-dependent hydrolase (beta-lactamase superfamily II)